MERKKLFVCVGIGVAGALLLVGIFAVANAVGDSNAMRRGIDEGFELRGAIRGIPAGTASAPSHFRRSTASPRGKRRRLRARMSKARSRKPSIRTSTCWKTRAATGSAGSILRTPMPRGRERCTSATARATWWRCARWIGCPVICATITNEIPDQMRFALAAADIRARSLPSARAFRFSTKRKPFHVRW